MNYVTATSNNAERVIFPFGEIATHTQFYCDQYSVVIEHLFRLFNSQSQLFDQYIANGQIQRLSRRQSIYQSLIALVCIKRSGADYHSAKLNPHELWAKLSRKINPRSPSRLIGLYVWANAIWEFEPVHTLLARFCITADNPKPFLDKLPTGALALFCTGTLHEFQRTGAVLAENLSRKSAFALQGRYIASSNLPNRRKSDTSQRQTHKWSGHSADQFLALHALAFGSALLGDSFMLEVAEHLADSLVTMQGPQGQWWAQYDSNNKSVRQHYPISAVVQHSLAPIAFTSVEMAGGKNYNNAIARSIGWLQDNELQVDLTGSRQQPLLKGIGYKAPIVTKLRILFGSSSNTPALKLLDDTLPQDLSWFLYASAVEAPEPSL